MVFKSSSIKQQAASSLITSVNETTRVTGVGHVAGPAEFFAGQIGKIATLNVALTEAELSTIYEHTRGLYFV